MRVKMMSKEQIKELDDLYGSKNKKGVDDNPRIICMYGLLADEIAQNKAKVHSILYGKYIENDEYMYSQASMNLDNDFYDHPNIAHFGPTYKDSLKLVDYIGRPSNVKFSKFQVIGIVEFKIRNNASIMSSEDMKYFNRMKPPRICEKSEIFEEVDWKVINEFIKKYADSRLEEESDDFYAEKFADLFYKI
jgi:hypothetical protein